jgi:cell division protease FtsH
MDITQATRLARSMVCEWGMSPLGTVAYDERTGEGQYLGMNNMAERSYSEETAKQIDAEVRKMMDLAHEQAIEIINKNRDKVELMTKMLIKFETLDKEDVKEMMDGTWTDVKKEARLKATENLQRKSPATAPVKTGPASDTPEPQQA